MKSSLGEGKLAGSFTNPEKRQIEALAEEGLQWVDDNKESTAEEIEAFKQKLTGRYNPIMIRVYEEAGVKPGTEFMV